jgi:HEAT repeat protein
VQGLLALASDEIGAVREAAYESLGVLGAIEALDVLINAFDDEHRGARQAAVLAAGRVAPEQAPDEIASLLEDSRPEMRFAAIWTLSCLGAGHSNRIAAALRDEDEEVRLLASRSLADLGATDHIDAIAVLLDDPSDAVRFGAATSLATLGDKRGAPALRAGLTRPEHAFAAAIALGDLADRDSLGDLARLAKQRWRSPTLRAAAARALVRLGEPEGAEVLRKIVRSWRIEARQYAVQLVGELGLISLVPDLARAFRRSRRSERSLYETVLEELAPNSPEAQALLASIRPSNQPVSGS